MRVVLRVLILVFLVLLFSGCELFFAADPTGDDRHREASTEQEEAEQEETEQDETEQDETEQDETEQELIAELAQLAAAVNDQRSFDGVAPLVWNDDMAAFAESHNDYQAGTGASTLENEDGQLFIVDLPLFVPDVGFPRLGQVGEGFSDGTTFFSDMMSIGFFADQMADPDFTHFGAAFLDDGTGRYWTYVMAGM
ncbi:MAG: hypothetical protein EA426_02995 [Spirochaetaceae bacterium]|nr:MAG: hypothetical protein EA426_02995 [Spirochaetaceae bacterium]